MPEVSRFFDIVIYMYFNEHPPAHFHAKYHDFRVQVSIKTLEVIEGRLPPKQMKLLIKWAREHQDELLRNWVSLQDTGKFDKITPLA